MNSIQEKDGARETDQGRLDFRVRGARPAGGRHSQAERILAVLQERAGQWVPLPVILALGVAQYNTRISELRRDGHNIRNKTEWVGRECHSWFGLNVPEGKA